MKCMTREQALEIAKDFIRGTNPTGWNGDGDPPNEFLALNTITEDGEIEMGDYYVLCEVDEDTAIKIRYDDAYYDESGGWSIWVEYGYKYNGVETSSRYCDEINNIGKLADAILDVQNKEEIA